MFKKIEALSSETHQDLRFSQVNSFNFAANVLNAPLSASELSMAGRYYPIVFPDQGTSPVALFALNQKTNLYIDKNGSWKVPYIPAHIRRYPFILANADKENPDKFVVCIDRKSPHFDDNQGDPMFTADGTPAEITEKAIGFLQKFQEEMKATQTVCRELEEQNVLVKRNFSIEKNGQTTSIGGFRCVDMEKLNKLDDKVLAKWVRNGLIGLINTHLQSLGNLKLLA